MSILSYIIELKRTDSVYLCYLGIYTARHNELAANYPDYLSNVEQIEFQRLKHDKRQHSYLLGRICAKELCAKNFGIAAKDITISNGIFGQPLLQTNLIESHAISISHSDNSAAVLIYPTAHPMGIDIENIQNANQHVIKQYITTSELALLEQNDSIAQLPLMIWSAREAAAKVLQCGMGVPKHVIAVKDLKSDQDRYYFNFENFFHIKACSILLDDTNLLTIALPSNSELGSF